MAYNCLNKRLLSVFSWIAVAVMLPALAAADWVTVPSYFTHDPQTGERVQQYSPIGPFYTYSQSNFQRSGYRQTRSSIQAGESADHMHIVEEWGKPVRPYGEWRFPYRPYSVPYGLWGPTYPFPYGFAQPGFGIPPIAGPLGGAFPYGPPRETPGHVTPPFQPYPGYFPQPYDDGRYPPHDSNGPYGYPDLLQRRPARIRPADATHLGPGIHHRGTEDTEFLPSR